MRRHSRLWSFVLLAVAGETVFLLPFVIPRIFRPLMMEAWGLNNTIFGAAFSAYGVTAMLSYLLGGPLADRYSARLLISSSLFLTTLGGLWLLMFPTKTSLICVYGFFGVSTIFLMWGALIKTTHLEGGETQRASAMGILDAGRGLSAAIVASLLVWVAAFGSPDLSTQTGQTFALNSIYITTVLFTLFVATLVWFFLKEPEAKISNVWSYPKALSCLSNSQVWLLSVIVLGAYCGYKAIDNYAAYLVTVQKMDMAGASYLTSLLFWLRPLAAVTAGVLADRWHTINSSARFLVLLSLLACAGFSQLLLTLVSGSIAGFAISSLFLSAAFAFALRSIYFSVFGDLHIPSHLVGTVTGIVSFVGFLPDMFFGLVTGVLIDTYPGAKGFHLSFLFAALMLFIGALASFRLWREVMLPPRSVNGKLN